MPKPVIFSLRPEPDCREDIVSLRQAGLGAEALPMLAIDRDEGNLTAALHNLAEQPDAQLILTSKQAARMLITAPAAIHNRRVWCVGIGTAALLTEAGFTQVIAGDGSAQSLVQKITAADRHIQKAASGPGVRPAFLWLSGADIAVDIQAGLAALSAQVTRHIIYKMAENSPESSAFVTACNAGQKIAVMAMSARTITLFSTWLKTTEIEAYRPEITLILQSPAQLALANRLGLRGFCAPLPSRDSMLACAVGWANKQGM